MGNKKQLVIIIRTLSLLFVLGGTIRLLANRSIFGLFGMDALWADHAYFIYIYRVLGAFVILTGLLLHGISKNLEVHALLIPYLKWAFLIIGIVMLVTGFLVKLPWIFYLFDFVFCFGLAWFFNYVGGVLKKV